MRDSLHRNGGGEEEGANLCVLCQDSESKWGFMHGDSVHMGLCDECCSRFKHGKHSCPLCRAPVEKLLRVYT